MRWQINWSWTCVLLALLAAAGCGDPPQFRVTTVVRPDGSCARTILQPRGDHLPNEATTKEVGQLAPAWIARWQTVEYLPSPRGRLKSADKNQSDKFPYFQANGSFASVAQIPPHYRYLDADAPEAGASELERTFSRTDFGAFVEYRWEETVTNDVPLDVYIAARDKILDELLPLVAAEMSRSWGKQYDTRELEAFIVGEGREIAVAASLAFYENRATHLPSEQFYCRLATIVQRYHFDWPTDSAGCEAELAQGIESCVAQAIARFVKQRDGKPLAKEDVAALMEKGIDADKSDKDASDEKWKSLPTAKAFGVYPWLQIVRVSEEFDFSITLPGKLVETNGLILGVDKCRWQFKAWETFPVGYRMHARSLAFNTASQHKLLGHVAFEDIAKAIELIDAVGHEGPLLAAVQQAFASGKLEPISALESESSEQQERIKKLRALLDLR